MMPLNEFYSWINSVKEKSQKYLKFAISPEADCVKDILDDYKEFHDSAKAYSQVRNYYESLNRDMEDFIGREKYENAKELLGTLNNVKESASQLEKRMIKAEEDILFAMEFCAARTE